MSERPTKKRKVVASNPTKQDLITICRQNNWKNYSKLRKPELVFFVALCQLRERWASRILSEKFVPLVREMCHNTTVVNKEDPFSMEPINPARLFRMRSCAKFVYMFDAKNLMKYFCSEGVFKNPFTQKYVPDHCIRKLHRRYFQVVSGNSWLVLEYGRNTRKIIITEKTDIVHLKSIIKKIKDEERQLAQTVNLLAEEFSDALYITLSLIRDCDGAVPEVCSIAWLMLQFRCIPNLLSTAAEVSQASPETCYRMMRNATRLVAAEVDNYEPRDARMAMGAFLLVEVLRMTAEVTDGAEEPPPPHVAAFWARINAVVL